MTGALTSFAETTFQAHFAPVGVARHINEFIQRHRDPLREQRVIVPRGYDRLRVEWLDELTKTGITNREIITREISRKALNGTYEFGPALEREIVSGPKRRSVWRSALRDQIAQYVLYRVLEELCDHEFASCSYGFRQGRSYHDAIRHLNESLKAGRCVVFEADIRSFFDTVPHEGALRAAGRRCGSFEPLMRLLGAYMRSARFLPIESERQYQRVDEDPFGISPNHARKEFPKGVRSAEPLLTWCLIRLIGISSGRHTI